MLLKLGLGGARGRGRGDDMGKAMVVSVVGWVGLVVIFHFSVFW
jgi:hypothetical protein